MSASIQHFTISTIHTESEVGPKLQSLSTEASMTNKFYAPLTLAF